MATNLYHAKIHIQNMTKHIIHPARSILSQHMSAQLFCTRTAQKHHCICYSISPSHPTSQYNGTAFILVRKCILSIFIHHENPNIKIALMTSSTKNLLFIISISNTPHDQIGARDMKLQNDKQMALIVKSKTKKTILVNGP